MNNILLEKAYNCYMIYLDHLNYGKVNQNYCMVYGAILAIANNITDEQFVQYFEEHLLCENPLYKLTITEDMDRYILWTLSPSDVLLSNFSWNEIPAPTNTTYPFTTNSLYGFNYLYVSVPQNENFIIYNELNMSLYDSSIGAGELNQIFTLIGTMTLDNGNVNNVYKKNDVYNTNNSVLFKVRLY